MRSATTHNGTENHIEELRSHHRRDMSAMGSEIGGSFAGIPSCPGSPRKRSRFSVSELTRDIRALEAGTGRSTIWFAQRVKSLIAIEHDNSWFEKVPGQSFDSACIHNVTLELWSASEDASGSIPYVDRVKQITDNSLVLH